MRRIIYWTLFAVTVCAPVCFILYVSFAPSTEAGLAGISVHSWLVATLLLCIWCAVYVRDEPALVRLALIWVFIVLSAISLGIHVSKGGF